MEDTNAKELLAKLQAIYTCIRPYRNGKLYYLERFGEKVKQINLTYPYLGTSYSKILESENKMFIENTIIYKIREKDKQIDFTSMYPCINITMPLFGGKRGDYGCNK